MSARMSFAGSILNFEIDQGLSFDKSEDKNLAKIFERSRMYMSARMSGAGDTLRSPLRHPTPHSPVVLKQHTDTSWSYLTVCNQKQYCLQFGEMQFAMLTNTFSELKKYNHQLDKYVFQFGQILKIIWTNTFYPLRHPTPHSPVVLGQHTDTPRSCLTVCNKQKYSLPFEEMQFAMLTNKFCKLEKYIWQLDRDVFFFFNSDK